MTYKPRALFVYGTLRPGGRYWRNLEDLVVQYDPGLLDGFEMWDLPDGYPAIIEGAGRVFGDILYLGRGKEAEALAIADAIEQFDGTVGSLYLREEVEVTRLAAVDGPPVPAETYLFSRDRRPFLMKNATRVPGGDWREFVAQDRHDGSDGEA